MATNIHIYCLKDPITNEIRYIGKTIQDPLKRYCSHISQSKNNRKKDYCHCWIKSLLNKNLKPILEIIENTTDITRESFYIFKYKSNKLTNFTNGGELGNIGLHWKINPAKVKPKYEKKVFVYDTNGKYKEFKSVKECSKELNEYPKTISKLSQNKILTKDGKIVSYIKLETVNFNEYKYRRYSNIDLYYNNNKIKTFYSAKKLSEYFNLDISTICKYIKNNIMYKEYSFKKSSVLW
jgi:hypothetical protein